jgi:hypothetical protein
MCRSPQQSTSHATRQRQTPLARLQKKPYPQRGPNSFWRGLKLKRDATSDKINRPVVLAFKSPYCIHY